MKTIFYTITAAAILLAGVACSSRVFDDYSTRHLYQMVNPPPAVPLPPKKVS
ncbi:MAG: hypothetical protein ACAH27_05990 [Xanthobacteraceae bacterium]